MRPIPALLAAALLAAQPSGGAAAAGAGLPLGCSGLRIAPELPADAALATQAGFNCFAWQQFIALNWPAAPEAPGDPDREAKPAGFGRLAPGQRTVWESFRDANALFRPGPSEPPPWDARAPLHPDCRGIGPVETAHAAGAPRLYMTAKVFEPQRLDGSLLEAGQGGNAYLVGRNGRPVSFDVRLNRDFYDYVRANRLYDPRVQAEATGPGGPGIHVPPGSRRTGTVGGMEVKAAWLQIEDPADWPRHRTVTAILHDAAERPACRLAHLALVGLHIAHKTETAEQWVWATFEHVDNAPDAAAVEAGRAAGPYTFFDPGCAGADCEWNTPPARGADGPPVQVVRLTPVIDEPGTGNNVAGLNAAVHRMIRAAAPGSVWQHYRLVNVQWPQSPVPVRGSPTSPRRTRRCRSAGRRRG